MGGVRRIAIKCGGNELLGECRIVEMRQAQSQCLPDYGKLAVSIHMFQSTSLTGMAVPYGSAFAFAALHPVMRLAIAALSISMTTAVPTIVGTPGCHLFCGAKRDVALIHNRSFYCNCVRTSLVVSEAGLPAFRRPCSSTKL